MKLSASDVPGYHNWVLHKSGSHIHEPEKEKFRRGLPTHIKGERGSFLLHIHIIGCSLFVYVHYVFYTMYIFHNLRAVMCLNFETRSSSDSLQGQLDISRDVSLNVMLAALSRLPEGCPAQTPYFRHQVSNFVQATKKVMEKAFMNETVQGCKLMCNKYYFESTVRQHVPSDAMIFLTKKDEISKGEGKEMNFHLVLSCKALLENVQMTLPYSSVGSLPAHNNVSVGPAQAHLDETHKLLVNNYPLCCVGHSDVQLR